MNRQSSRKPLRRFSSLRMAVRLLRKDQRLPLLSPALELVPRSSPSLTKQNGSKGSRQKQKNFWSKSTMYSVFFFFFCFLFFKGTNKTSLEISTMHDSWLAVLHTELTKPYFLTLKKFLKVELAGKEPIFPPEKDIYSWSRLTPLNTVKIVILGQDPYHNFNQAHGLAFSVNPPTPAPPSLKNMYKGLKIDYPDFKPPKNGLLTPWAEQGVLMLNTALTVRAHKANSHSNKGWETFTEQVLAAVVKSRPAGVCFLAWGTPAGKRIDKINPDLKVHTILRSVHPSPLSASRGFFDGHHFKKSNEWLLEKYGPDGVINWALDPDNVIAEIAEMKKKSTIVDAQDSKATESTREEPSEPATETKETLKSSEESEKENNEPSS